MSLAELTSPDAVRAAMREFDEVGREAFLTKYGYGPAKRYFVREDDRLYDSKAIVGAAFGYEHPDRGPLANDSFSGGEPVRTRLEQLGFTVVVDDLSAPQALESALAELDEARLEARREAEQAARELLNRSAGSMSEYDFHRLFKFFNTDFHKGRARSDRFSPGFVGSTASMLLSDLENLNAWTARIWTSAEPDALAAVGDLLADRKALYGAATGYPTILMYLRDPAKWPIWLHSTHRGLQAAWSYQPTKGPGSGRLEDYEAFSSSARQLMDEYEVAPELLDLVLAAAGRSKVTPSVDEQVWLFQANPRYYDIDRALRELQAIEWTVRQYRRRVKEGDRVYVWRSGPGGGVVATGRIASDVYESLPDPSEDSYYRDREAFSKSEPRVRIAVERLVDPVLQRELLQSDPVLSELSVLRFANATVHEVKPDEDERLRELIDGVAAPARYFVLQQRADTSYELDTEGQVYHFTPNASGSWRRLSDSSGARFVYYRPGSDGGATARSFFGSGRIARVDVEERNGERHFLARVEDYAPFARPVSRAEFDPRPNVQMSIAEISRQQYEELVRRGGRLRMEPFTVDSIRRAGADPPRNLLLGDEIYASVFSALQSGKHVILTGPPGTAKTTLAEAVADAAARSGLCAGHVLTTATADWTTYETIGGLKPVKSGELEFTPGHFLDAIQNNQWLVIDELNRSNFDRAFGQLFTVLSGQAVRLPYTRPAKDQPLTLVPEGVSAPPGSDALVIPDSWRIVATMNVFDKSLLFEMSFALMRRFAFIEVPSPADAVVRELVSTAAEGDPQAVELTMALHALRTHKDLGPAVFMDMGRYLAHRGQMDDGVEQGQLAFEAFYSFLLPQFEGIDQPTGEKLYASLKPLVGAKRSERVRLTLNAVLGLESALPPPTLPKTRRQRSLTSPKSSPNSCASAVASVASAGLD